MQSHKRQSALCSFPRQTIQYNSNSSLCPNRSAEKAETKWFYEDPQDFLELTHKKDVLFIVGDWNSKVGSKEIPGVTGKFGLGVKHEAGQRLTEEFCQENALVIATPSSNSTRDNYMWTSSDGQY